MSVGSQNSGGPGLATIPTGIAPPPNTPGLPVGLVGATAATRYVGGTTTGAPVTGTFAVGDFVIAQDGVVWICTGAGSPGTWVPDGSTLYMPIAFTVNAQTGTSYALLLGDANKLVTLTNVGAIALTIPTNANAAIAIGAQVNLAALGAGQVTVAGDTGVTVNGTPGLKLRAQYSAATAIKLATNTWLLVGDLSA